MRFRFTLNWIIVVLALVLGVPLALLTIYNVAELQLKREAAAQRLTLNLAAVAAANVSQLLNDARDVMDVAATLPILKHADYKSCPLIEKELRPHLQRYTDMMLLGADGNVICSSAATHSPAAVMATMPWFRAIQHGNTFAVSEPFLDSHSGRWISMFAVPVAQNSSAPPRVLAVALDLEYLSTDFLPRLNLPNDTVVGILSSEGRIVARTVDAHHWIGQDARQSDVFRRTQHPESGTWQVDFLDGKTRLLATAEIIPADWHAYVGVDVEAMSPSLEPQLVRNALANLLITLLVLLAGLYFVRHTARPIRAIANGARTFRLNQLNVQLPVDGPAEVAEVAAEFNQMTRSLRSALMDLKKNEQDLSFIFEHVPAGITLTGLDRRWTRVNSQFAKMLGYTPEELLGKRPEELTYPDDRGETIKDMHDLEQGHVNVVHLEKRYLHRDGTTVWARVVGRLARDEAGAPQYFVSIAEDITAHRAIEEKQRQLAKVFESSAEAIVIMDTEGSILTVNHAFSDITGYTEAEIAGRSSSGICADPADAEVCSEAIQTAIRHGIWRGEMWHLRKSGERYPAWLTISPVTDDSGKLLNLVGVFSDITHIKESEQRLERLTHFDALTGLPNRTLFTQQLSRFLQQLGTRKTALAALLLLDVDEFKTINDTLGHAVGDRLLQLLAKRLRGTLHGGEILARVGGDEFAIIQPSPRDSENVARLARRVLDVFSDAVVLDGEEIFVTASIGVSIYPRDGQDDATLLKAADAALYRAKAEGRNRYEFFTQELASQAQEQFSLVVELRKALENGDFIVHYQPKYSLQNGAITGAEALIRWPHPVQGMISPARFIPVAEQAGLIEAIGEQVLKMVCRQLRRWRDRKLEVHSVSVNLSGRQIVRQGLPEKLSAIVGSAGIPFEAIELEITETAIMQHALEAANILARLKQAGFSLAIDDFGIGYSSLSYLQQFTVDRLKIDQSFVRGLPEAAGDVSIARAIIALGHSLGYVVVAEGVETDAQREFLRREGCDEMQGYLACRPLPPEEFEKLLGPASL